MSATDKAAAAVAVAAAAAVATTCSPSSPSSAVPLPCSACSHKHNKFLRLSRAAASPPKTKANYKFIMRESNFMTCGFSFGYRYTLSIRNVEQKGKGKCGRAGCGAWLTSVKTQFTVAVNQGTSCKLLLVMLSQQPPSQNNKRHCRRPTSPYLFD